MSKYFDGSSLAGMSYCTLDNAAHPLVSDGNSLFYQNSVLSTSTEDFGGRYKYTVPVTGDFEVSANLTIPSFSDFVLVDKCGVYLDFYINFSSSVYTTDGTDSSSNLDFYMYDDSNQASGIVFKEYNFGVPITLSYPWTGDIKVVKSGTTITVYVGESVLWTGTHDNNLNVAVKDIDLRFNYDAATATPAFPVTVPQILVNDVSFVGNTTSSIATLAGLKVNATPAAAMSPTFAAATTAYSQTVGYLVSETTFNILSTDSTATITINGTPVQSNLISPAFALNPGSNSFTVSVLASDGVTTKDYVLTVNRNETVSSVATLKEIYSYTLTPAFNATVYNYTYTTLYTASYISFRISSTDAFASIKVNGVPHVSGQYYYFNNLAVGDNVYTIVVTAEDGVTVQTYTLNLYRTPASTDATLTSLIVSGTYGSTIGTDTTNPCRKFTMVQNSTFDFTATNCRAYNDVVLVYCAPSSSYAGITIDNVPYVKTGYVYNRTPSRLVPGDNTITVKCTAQDGVTINTYTIHVNMPEKYAFAFGSGTKSDPYQVWTAEDLNGVRDWSGCEYYPKNFGMTYVYFKQMADIDLSAYPSWVPLGTNKDESSYNCGYFSNYYDGNGFEISNLTINGNTDSARIGLFDTVGMPLFSDRYRITDKTTARLTNITIKNAVLTMNKSNIRAGILCGQAYFPFLNCQVQGSLEYPTDILSTDTTERRVGGLVGEMAALQCYAYRCGSNVTITLHDHPASKPIRANVGGFLGGFLDGGTLDLVPFVHGIYESYAIATIEFPAKNVALSQTYLYVGGFIGKAHSSATTKENATVIKDCFSRATLNVNAEVYTGVFAGMNYYPIYNSYAIGTITESPDGVNTTVGGFAGSTATSYKDVTTGSSVTKTLNLDTCYFDDTVYNVNNATPFGNVDYVKCGAAKTTAEMQVQETFVGWDYENVWAFDPTLNDGYPVLLWTVPIPVFYNVAHYVKQHGRWVEVADTNSLLAADVPDFEATVVGMVDASLDALLNADY